MGLELECPKIRFWRGDEVETAWVLQVYGDGAAWPSTREKASGAAGACPWKLAGDPSCWVRGTCRDQVTITAGAAGGGY